MSTCNYIDAVKRKAGFKYPPLRSQTFTLKEAAMVPEFGLTVPVRAARARLSALLEMVAAGREVTITSDGKPKAVLAPVTAHRGRKVFTGTIQALHKLPMQTEGPYAEEIIRADRDGRGW